MWIDERRISDVVTAMTVAGMLGLWAFDERPSDPSSTRSIATGTAQAPDRPSVTTSGIGALFPPVSDPAPAVEAAPVETAAAPVETSPPTPAPVVSDAELGPVCGDLRLTGAPLAPLTSDLDDRCRVDDAVSLSAVGALTVSPPLVASCGVAQQLAVWVHGGLAEAAAARGGGPLTGVVQVSGFVCRNRNNASDGRLSEHAFGRAIDIAAFQFADGASVAVADHWGADSADGSFLADAWASACGPFGTVLGPEADAFHDDHFHLDVAERRSAYCR